MSVNIAVLGAGVIGLSTAINVQRAIPNARVTIIADKFYEGTTSYGSGGMFVPSMLGSPNVPVEDLRNWSRESWNFYRQIALSPDAGEVGTIIMSGYNLFNKDLSPQDPIYKEFVFSCKEMSKEELKDHGFQHFRTGYHVTTIIIFMRKYLVWLRKRFEENGGRFVKRHIDSIEEISDQYNLVMNCCGAGSGALVGDTRAQPVRGHIVRVRAPWIKHWFLTDGNTYVIPGEDLVGLGTVKQAGNVNLDVDPGDSKDIIERCENLCPNLKQHLVSKCTHPSGVQVHQALNMKLQWYVGSKITSAEFVYNFQGAQIDHEWVGLRPGRDRIRLESEIFKSGDKNIPVVHNYGHSSQGIGLSWGTAVYAAKLAVEILSTNSGSKL